MLLQDSLKLANFKVIIIPNHGDSKLFYLLLFIEVSINTGAIQIHYRMNSESDNADIMRTPPEIVEQVKIIIVLGIFTFKIITTLDHIVDFSILCTVILIR